MSRVALTPTPGLARSVRMKKWLSLACLVAALAFVSVPTCAQFNDPHTYDNAPIDVNQIELAYAYGHANTSIDTSLIITGASLTLQQGTIDYTRYFGLAKHLGWRQNALTFEFAKVVVHRNGAAYSGFAVKYD